MPTQEENINEREKKAYFVYLYLKYVIPIGSAMENNIIFQNQGR